MEAVEFQQSARKNIGIYAWFGFTHPTYGLNKEASTQDERLIANAKGSVESSSKNDCKTDESYIRREPVKYLPTW